MRFRKSAGFTVPVLLILAQSINGNGYDDYPPDLAWSPVDDALAAAVDGELLLWTPDNTATVAEGEVRSPSFSPDGRYVAFVMDEELHYFRTDRPESVRNIPRTGTVTACTFDPMGDPDDPAVCYTEDFLGSRLMAVFILSGDVFQILPEDSDVRVSAPVISPDGTNIACCNFAMNPTWYEELYIIGASAPSGRRARVDTTYYNWSDWHESNPLWLTGRVLLYQIGGWGEWELRFLNVDSGLEKDFLENAHQVSASADGSILAFCRKDPFPQVDFARSWEDPTCVWVMDRDADYMTQASESGAWADQPALSGNGNYVAWIEHRAEGGVLIVKETREFLAVAYSR